jgi:hypothetical protein
VVILDELVGAPLANATPGRSRWVTAAKSSHTRSALRRNR